jgi:hypothetical protein
VKLNLKVKSKFIVNGKEYTFPEEMPDDVRQAYEKARGSRFGALHAEGSTRFTSKITFNGQVYENPDAMPPDIRQTYDHVMKSVLKGDVSPELIAGRKANGASSGHGAEDRRTAEGPMPMVFESAFSNVKRRLAVGFILLILLGALYYVLSTSSSR